MRRFWGVLWGRGSPHCGVCAHVPPADSGSAVRRAAFQAWRCGQQAGRPRQPVRGQSGLQPPQLLAGPPQACGVSGQAARRTLPRQATPDRETETQSQQDVARLSRAPDQEREPRELQEAQSARETPAFAGRAP